MADFCSKWPVLVHYKVLGGWHLQILNSPIYLYTLLLSSNFPRNISTVPRVLLHTGEQPTGSSSGFSLGVTTKPPDPPYFLSFSPQWGRLYISWSISKFEHNFLSNDIAGDLANNQVCGEALAVLEVWSKKSEGPRSCLGIHQVILNLFLLLNISFLQEHMYRVWLE